MRSQNCALAGNCMFNGDVGWVCVADECCYLLLLAAAGTLALWVKVKVWCR